MQNSNNSKKKLLKNTIFSSGGYTVTSIIMFLTIPYLIKKLGTEVYGIYVLLTSIGGYYGLLDLGLGQGITKFIAEYNEKNETHNIIKSINAALLLQIVLGLSISIILVLFSDAILHFLNISNEYYPVVKNSFFVCTIGFFFTMISGTFNAIMAGFQRYDITSKIDVMMNIGINVSLVIVLMLGKGLFEIVCVTIGYSFVGCCVYFFFVTRQMRNTPWIFIVDIQQFKSIFQFSGFLFLSKLAGTFSTYFVRFIISSFLSPVAVTYYVVPTRLISAIGGFLMSASNAVFPYSSAINAKNNKEEIHEFFIRATQIFLSFSFPLALFLFAFSRQILTVWVGKDFSENAWMVLSILSFSSMIGSTSVIPNLIIMGMGNSRLIGLFSIISIILYIILFPIFVKLWSVIGIAFAMLVVSLSLISFVLHKTTTFLELDTKYYIEKVFKIHSFPILFSICLFFFQYFECLNIDSVILILFIGFILLLSYYIFLGWKNIFPLKLILSKFY